MMRFDPDSVDWPPSRRPGISVRLLWQDESSGDAAVLIRMEPGATYPRHLHVGDEDVLVLQGGFRDEQVELKCGEFRRFPAGSIHAPVAIEGGPPCVLFAVARGGIRLVR
ncbi:MAG: cupin domain-containing protein [Planctomycetes bacterium]|nr:cupin domain-containing protein [Planctomycetota bacterium]